MRAQLTHIVALVWSQVLQHPTCPGTCHRYRSPTWHR